MVGEKSKDHKLLTLPMENSTYKQVRKQQFLLIQKGTIDDPGLNLYEYVLLDLVCMTETSTSKPKKSIKRCYYSMTYCSSAAKPDCFCLKIGLPTDNRDDLDMWILDLETLDVLYVPSITEIKLFCCDRNRVETETDYQKYLDLFKKAHEVNWYGVRSLIKLW